MYAFTRCKDLVSVQISEGPTDIGAEAFRGCIQLKSIYIPSTVMNYNQRIFSGCTGLDSIEVGSQYPVAITKDVFEEIDISKITLVIPYNSKDMYEIATVWKDFGTIIEKSSSTNERLSDVVSLKIYPNPASDYIIVTCNDSSIGDELSIFNVNGNIIERIKITGTRMIIDISSYLKGVYIMNLKGESYKLLKR